MLNVAAAALKVVALFVIPPRNTKLAAVVTDVLVHVEPALSVTAPTNISVPVLLPSENVLVIDVVPFTVKLPVLGSKVPADIVKLLFIVVVAPPVFVPDPEIVTFR